MSRAGIVVAAVLVWCGCYLLTDSFVGALALLTVWWLMFYVGLFIARHW